MTGSGREARGRFGTDVGGPGLSAGTGVDRSGLTEVSYSDRLPAIAGSRRFPVRYDSAPGSLFPGFMAGGRVMATLGFLTASLSFSTYALLLLPLAGAGYWVTCGPKRRTRRPR